VPDAVLERGETHEDWYPLSGKTGDLKEGMIDLVLSFTPVTAYQRGGVGVGIQQPVMLVPNASGRALPVYVSPQPVIGDQQQAIPQQPPQIQIRPLTEEDITNLMEMFPNVDKEAIKSIGEANCGNKEATINSLLQLTN
jgi:toll-interacting protein